MAEEAGPAGEGRGGREDDGEGSAEPRPEEEELRRRDSLQDKQGSEVGGRGQGRPEGYGGAGSAGVRGSGGPRAYRVQVGMEGHARYPWWPVLGACEVE